MTEAAKNGFPKAWIVLAEIYREERNESKEKECYFQATRFNYIEAFNRLGELHQENGNFITAICWFKKAEKYNDKSVSLEATLKIASLFYRQSNIYLKENKTKNSDYYLMHAKRYYLKISSKDKCEYYSQAQSGLGDIYASRVDIYFDTKEAEAFKKALKYYQEAHSCPYREDENQKKEIQYKIAELHSSVKEYQTAFENYSELALTDNHTESQYKVGHFFEVGKGKVKQNIMKALFYYSLAAKANESHNPARKKLLSIADKNIKIMSSDPFDNALSQYIVQYCIDEIREWDHKKAAKLNEQLSEIIELSN